VGCGRYCGRFGKGLGAGGLRFGSGTHGLQTRTVSPPQLVIAPGNPSSKAISAIGGCTINCRGIVILWGEQLAHTTLPHLLLSKC
jgi:hypothetical protein